MREQLRHRQNPDRTPTVKWWNDFMVRVGKPALAAGFVFMDSLNLS
ncbi:MAG: hypothetical protein ABF384_06705 [Verrucomicrobiales bacterium]